MRLTGLNRRGEHNFAKRSGKPSARRTMVARAPRDRDRSEQAIAVNQNFM
jgi:hypothetical protein